jgi:hypothetical protein
VAPGERDDTPAVIRDNGGDPRCRRRRSEVDFIRPAQGDQEIAITSFVREFQGPDALIPIGRPTSWRGSFQRDRKPSIAVIAVEAALASDCGVPPKAIRPSPPMGAELSAALRPARAIK